MNLNVDVLTSIAEYLPLEDYARFSSVCKKTNQAAKRIPTTVILIRDIENDFKFNEIPKTILRLLVGKGAANTTPENLRKMTQNEKDVLFAKVTTLKITMKSMSSTLEPERYIEILKEMLTICVNVKNYVVMKELIELSHPSQLTLKAINQEFVEGCITQATEKSLYELIPFLVQSIGFERVNLEVLIACCKSARENSRTRSFATLLALIIKCSPNLEAVNELISNTLKHCAAKGQEQLCLELAKMFQLRVRFKKLIISKDLADKKTRETSKLFTKINEEIEEERIRGEEIELSEAMKIFKRSLQGILEIACRNEHTTLARKLLESKLATDIDESIMDNFFKTAVGCGDKDTALWLVKGRKLGLHKICSYFIDCARRNHISSVELLLDTDIIPNPTITIAKTEAIRRGHTELVEILKLHLI